MKHFGNNNSIENPTLLTPFSLVHLLSGITLFILLSLFTKNKLVIIIGVFIIHTIYEFKDYYTTYINKIRFEKDNYLSEFFIDNTFINSIGDTIACIIGIIIGYYLVFNTNLTLKYLLKTSLIMNVIFFAILVKLQTD